MATPIWRNAPEYPFGMNLPPSVRPLPPEMMGLNQFLTNMPSAPPPPNTIAANYSKLPKYNPGLEAVYNRMMSTPVAPNIGGEILKNLLGAYVGSNLGESKQNYLEAVQGKEREDRLADEQKSWQNRLALENQQKEAERQQMSKSLYDYMANKPIVDETGQPIGSNAIPPNIPDNTPVSVLSKIWENTLTPKVQKQFEFKDGYSFDPVTGKAIPVPGYQSTPIFEDLPLHGNNVQKGVSYDKGMTFQPVPGTVPYSRYKPEEPKSITEEKWSKDFEKQVAHSNYSAPNGAVYDEAMRNMDKYKDNKNAINAGHRAYTDAKTFVEGRDWYNKLTDEQKTTAADTLAEEKYNYKPEVIYRITGRYPSNTNQKQSATPQGRPPLSQFKK